MADTIYAPDPWAALSAQHSDIRREGSVERGEIRYDVATRNAENRYANAVGQADIRREQALGFGDVKYSIAEHSEATNRDILTTGYHNQIKVDEAADKILQRSTDFYISEQARDFDMGRDLADIKVQVAMGTQKTQADVALAQAQTGKEILESKYDLARQIGIENEKTRDLINSLKNDELNRLLIERNTDLQHCRHDYWGVRDGLLNSQFAALSSQVNSQVNALNSQLAETRQGMVNFGTMAGVGQSSTSNAVR